MMDKNIREEKQQITKDAILGAALELVREKGLDQFSLRQLASRVGYSPAGLYEYFESKDDIIAALASEGFRRFAVSMNGVSVELAPEERVIRIGLAYLEFARNNPDHFLLMFTGLPERNTELRAKVDDHSTFSPLENAMQAGIDQGVFRTVKDFGAQALAYFFWSHVHGMAMLQLTALSAMRSTLEPFDQEALEVLVIGLKNR